MNTEEILDEIREELELFRNILVEEDILKPEKELTMMIRKIKIDTKKTDATLKMTIMKKKK
jgi:hypothetical protein